MNSSILEAFLVYPLYLFGSVFMLTLLLTSPNSILRNSLLKSTDYCYSFLLTS